MSDTDYPEPSPEERAVQAAQADLFNLQKQILSMTLEQMNLLGPLFLEELGFEAQYEDIPATEATRELVGNKKFGDKLDKGTPVYEDTPATKARRKIIGYKKKFDPKDELRDKIEMMALERTRKALAGELPVSPSLLSGIETRGEEIKSQLIKDYGSLEAAEGSTAGALRLSTFMTGKEEVLEAARRGDLSTVGQFSLAYDQANQARVRDQIGGASGVIGLPAGLIPGLSATAGGFGNLSDMYARDRYGRYQADAADSAGINQFFATLAGAGAYKLIFCWVAEELYGITANKTYTIRSFVQEHFLDSSELGDFVREYFVHGRKWAEIIKTNKKARRAARKLWNKLYRMAVT